MSDRFSNAHFAALAFFVLVAYVAYSVGATSTLERVERREADRVAAQLFAYTDEQMARACADQVEAELVECVKEHLERYVEYRNAEYDLSAQEQMAVYAKWLLWVSIISVGITGLGLYLVWGTLAETRKATFAAQEAVGVTRDIGEAQVRAYLVFNGVQVVQQKDAGGNITGIGFRAVLRNSGQSPAEVLDLRSALGGAPIGLNEYPIVFPPNGEYRTRMEVGSGQEANTLGPFIPIDVFQSIVDQGLSIFLYAEASYYDIFHHRNRPDRPCNRACFAAFVQPDSGMIAAREHGTFGAQFTYAELSRFRVEGRYEG